MVRNCVSVKRIVGGVLGAFVLVAAVVLPAFPMLSREGMLALGILIAAVAMWVCDTLPIGITGLLCTALLYVFGAVDSFAAAFSGFTTLNVWFILAIFCMTAIMQKSSLGSRLARKLISLSGASSKRLVLAFMAVSAITSTIMTDAGAAVVTMGLAIAVLDGLGAEKGRSNLGKCLMLGIAMGATIGGFATPVSHALNVVGSGLYEQATGTQVNFLEWMSVGIPVAVSMVPIAWFFLVRAFPPEEIDRATVKRVVDETIRVGAWGAVDTKALVFIVAMPCMWISASFFPSLDPTVVTIIGLALMFLPCIDLLDWEYFAKCVNWNVFLMLGGIMCLGNAISSTGVSDLLSTLFLDSGIMSLNPYFALLAMAFAVYLAQTVLPVAPAFCTLLLPILIPYAEAAGISPLAPVLIICALLAGNFLLPLNPNNVITYSTGYYRFTEMAKGGWKPFVAHVVLVVTASVYITGMFW